MKSKSASPRVITAKPQNFLMKPLTVDFKELFKAIARGVSHAVSHKWTELGIDTVEALASLGLRTEPGELAHILVERALIKAVFDLLSDSSAQIIVQEDEDETTILATLSAALTDVPIDVAPSFLERPSELSIVSETQRVLERWLSLHKHTAIAASVIAKRFPSYFVYSLNHEWRTNLKSYKPLLEALDTPFSKAGEREWGWAAYAALLQKRVAEPSFDEAFSLSQVYIPVNAYHHEKVRGKEPGDDLRRLERKEKRTVVQLHTELRQWLSSSDTENALRVVSGGPGSGKSSFLRIFAADASAMTSTKVLFVPLHLIDPLKDLVEEVGRFTRDEGVLYGNPLASENPEPRLLLIFDGLDELASQGKAAQDAAKSFIREIERTLEKRNSVSLKLQVLISGRELVIQENESDFRRPRQVLTILPYYLTGRERDSSNQNPFDYVDTSELLSIDLRDAWWANYGMLTGRAFVGLPEELKRDDLDEITSQPLLNYLVALSYTRGQLDFKTNVNLNAVYGDLVTAVYDRGYEKHRTFGPIRHMSSAQFARVLEEIGLAAWHGDGRTTSVAEIEQHCHESGIGSLLELFQEGAQAGVTKLLAAFFFRQHGIRSTGEATFVFTHKSFGEYLAARRVSRAAEKLTKELIRRSGNPDEGWNERDALKHWAVVCGPTTMSTYIWDFVKTELQLLIDPSACQKELQRLFAFILRNGMPMEQIQLKTFRLQQIHARNAEEALLAVLNGCALVTKQLSDIEHPDPTAFGAWYKRIQGQRTGAQSVLAASCLSYLNLEGVCIDIGDFYGADLRHSNLRMCRAHFTNFSGANLDDADFSNAILPEADFDTTFLDGVKFVEAHLDGAKFVGSDLSDVDFTGARININDRKNLLHLRANIEKARVYDIESEIGRHSEPKKARGRGGRSSR